jgi:hypothetical protein
MAERTIKLAGISFREAEDAIIYNSEGKKVGIPSTGFGTRGQVVDVHEEDLERFDGHNDQYDTDEPDEIGPEDNETRRLRGVVEDKSRTDHPIFPQGPDPLDHGVGGDLVRPQRSERVDVWRDYAERLGVEDVDEKTKRELMDETADIEEEQAEEYRRAAAPQDEDTEELDVDEQEDDGFEETKGR